MAMKLGSGVIGGAWVFAGENCCPNDASSAEGFPEADAYGLGEDHGCEGMN